MSDVEVTSTNSYTFHPFTLDTFPMNLPSLQRKSSLTSQRSQKVSASDVIFQFSLTQKIHDFSLRGRFHNL